MSQSKKISRNNTQAAKEWLIKSWHNLSTAQLLYEADHYTDVIAVELHYSCEKILKSLLACQNKKIPKTHDILEIYNMISDYLDDKKSKETLDQISEYHIEESYPAYDRALPPREEIKAILNFTQELFVEVCATLDLEETEIKK